MTFCRIMFKLSTKDAPLLCTCCFIDFIPNIYSAGVSSTRAVRSLCFSRLYAHEWHINVVLAFSHNLHICLSRIMDVCVTTAFQADGTRRADVRFTNRVRIRCEISSSPSN